MSVRVKGGREEVDNQLEEFDQWKDKKTSDGVKKVINFVDAHLVSVVEKKCPDEVTRTGLRCTTDFQSGGIYLNLCAARKTAKTISEEERKVFEQIEEDILRFCQLMEHRCTILTRLQKENEKFIGLSQLVPRADIYSK